MDVGADDGFWEVAVGFEATREENAVVLVVGFAKLEVDVGEGAEEIDFVFKFGFYGDDFHILAPSLALFAHSSASSLFGSSAWPRTQ